jgi:hypothetical protein
MKTVEVLQHARQTLTDPSNWIQGALYGKRKDSYLETPERLNSRGAYFRGVEKLADANCFCSVGAVAKAMGVPKSTIVSSEDGISADNNKNYWFVGYVNNIPKYLSLSEFIKREWPDANQSQVRSIKTAVKYLNAAAFQLLGGGFRKAFSVNDNCTHKEVLAMFDLAIKNAKRRHVGGK